jgi:energy-coupling factor transporter transmembrane protein EcfT
VPGSPESGESKITSVTSLYRAGLHPAAALVACLAAGIALSLVRSPAILAVTAAALLVATLRVEGRGFRREIPLLALAMVVFLAHLLFGGRPLREALRPAGEIALRLLALLYLTRWAARTILPRAARWLFAQTGPRRPRPLALLFESGRVTVALLPLALGEAERQHMALRARAVRPGRGLAGRARYLAAWLLPYLGTMLRVGDAYGEALHARGYAMGSPRRAGASYRWGVADLALILGSVAATAWLVRVR